MPHGPPRVRFWRLPAALQRLRRRRQTARGNAAGAFDFDEWMIGIPVDDKDGGHAEV